MARSRRKGRDVSGWVIVDKPEGITSAAAVNKVRWAFDARKAGHAGTLDPDATGVLAVALGEATKTMPYVTNALKAYSFMIRLGQETNTDDAEGTVMDESEKRPSDAEIEAELPHFTGEIEQVPPRFSAVKVDGQRAYKRARSGDALQLEARPLYVDELALIERPDKDHATLHLVCGKGGYVRAIARDIGRKLGCFAHVASLRRLWSGPFDAEGAVTLETIESLAKAPGIDDLLLPLEAGLANLPELHCTPEGAARLRNGNPGMVLTSTADYGEEAWASCDGRVVAIGVYRAGELHPTRVFNPAAQQ